MNKSMAVAVLAMAFPLSIAARADGLKVDDAAPELTIQKWFIGDPVEIAKADPADVIVVTFWQSSQRFSRYYTPHLTDVQRRFKDKRVRVMAVTSETSDEIEKFLNSGWRKRIEFSIGFDRKGRSTRRWEPGPDAGVLGTTYVVKAGRIRWVGQALENLDLGVAEACGDTEFVKRAKDFQAQQDRFAAAYKAERWNDVLIDLEKMLAFKPRETRLNNAKYIVLASRKKDAKAAEACGKVLLANCDDAEALNELAWGMLTEKEWIGCRDLKFAKAVAEKAMTLTDQKNAAIVDTYARALWDGGDMCGAMQWQKRAVDLCESDPLAAEFREEIRKNMQTYQNRFNQGI